MRRRLRSTLAKLHSDYQSNSNTKWPERPTLQQGDTVDMRSFSAGPPWIATRVVAVMGPVSYTVQLANGEVYRRHPNHLRRPWTEVNTPCESTLDYSSRLPATADSTPPEGVQPEERQPLSGSTSKPQTVIRYGASVVQIFEVRNAVCQTQQRLTDMASFVWFCFPAE